MCTLFKTHEPPLVEGRKKAEYGVMNVHSFLVFRVQVGDRVRGGAVVLKIFDNRSENVLYVNDLFSSTFSLDIDYFHDIFPGDNTDR